MKQHSKVGSGRPTRLWWQPLLLIVAAMTAFLGGLSAGPDRLADAASSLRPVAQVADYRPMPLGLQKVTPAPVTGFAAPHLPLPSATPASHLAAQPVPRSRQGQCLDQYEPDNSPEEAKAIGVNGPAQTHSFDPQADQDWMWFQATRGVTYTIRTFNLVRDTDTVLSLYDTDGSTLLAINDDDPDSEELFASRIDWTAPVDGRYYIMVRDFFGRGDCLGYDIAVTAPEMAFRAYVPVLEGGEPGVPTPTPTPEPGIGRVVVPGLDFPTGVAVNPITNRVYVASRNNDRLMVLDGATNEVIDIIPVGDEPFGVAVNPVTNKIYVSTFEGGELYVIYGPTNRVIGVVRLGPGLTYVGVNSVTNRVYAVSHGLNGLFVLDGDRDSVTKIVGTGDPGIGAFGLAVSETLDRVYVSNRDTHDIAVFKGSGTLLPDQRIDPKPDRSEPFQLGFNPNTDRLYAMLAPTGNVKQVQSYAVTASDHQLLGTVGVSSGGRDGGGGVAINTATDHVIVTNSESNSISIIDGSETERLLATVPVGRNPYGVAVNPTTGRIYVGNKDSNDLYVLRDDF